MGTVFITVGTTKFDKLIQCIDTASFSETLFQKGYDKLVIQKGAGFYRPRTLVPKGNQHTLENGLQVEFFEFTPSLASYLQAAALVISHAGSGSIFETLHFGKPLIVVPNKDLMDNHQVDLGEKLSSMQNLVSAYAEDVEEAVRSLDVQKLKPYQKGAPDGIIARIDALVGIAKSK